MVTDASFRPSNTTFAKYNLLSLSLTEVSRGGSKSAPRPLRPKMFSISCSFSKILTKAYVGVHSYGESWILLWFQYKKHSGILRLTINQSDLLT